LACIVRSIFAEPTSYIALPLAVVPSAKVVLAILTSRVVVFLFQDWLPGKRVSKSWSIKGVPFWAITYRQGCSFIALNAQVAASKMV
jgi:hypothetical protein